MSALFVPRRLGLALLLSLAAASVWAQANPANTASREREMLRRAQAALQQTQAQRDALQAERDAALKAQQAAQGDLTSQKRGRAQLTAALARAEQALQDERAASAKALEAARAEQAVQTEKAAQAQREQAQAMAQLRRERDDVRAANLALVAKLAQSQTTLEQAQLSNRAMHALGVEAINRLRHRPSVDGPAGLLGLAAVAQENAAEGLRDRLDQQRLP